MGALPVHILVRNSNNVMKVRCTDGELLGSYGVAVGLYGVAFDGANIWVTNDSIGGIVSKF